jgi:hypothetical protein
VGSWRLGTSGKLEIGDEWEGGDWEGVGNHSS